MSQLPGLLICSFRPQENLVKLVKQLLRETYCFILVVDDGSGYRFDAIFRRLACLTRVYVVRLPKNLGKGEALKAGFRTVLSDSRLRTIPMTHLICVDSDGQHFPGDVKKLAAVAQKKPGVLILGARRFSTATPTRNLLGNQVARFAVNFCYGTSLADTQTGLRAIPLEYLDEFSKIVSVRFDYEMRQLLEAVSRKIKIQEVSIRSIYFKKRVSHFRVFRDSYLIGRAILSERKKSLFGVCSK